MSKDDHLYALGTYGVCLNKKDHNNDGNGIGRVIREIKADGTFGPIYFIYYNHGFNEHNTDYPNWRKGNKYLRRAWHGDTRQPPHAHGMGGGGRPWRHADSA